MSPGTVVVVGAGMAGSRCAESLRALGFDGRVVLFGDEAAAPYARPPLSKEFLAGERDARSLLLRPHEHWAERQIELRLDTAVGRIDLGARAVVTEGGDVVGWDALVVATGARARRLALPLPPGVHTLRTLRDALSLRRSLRPGSRLVVVGGGLVGTEVASTATRLGVSVELVSLEQPLERVAGPMVGRLLAERYRQAGVLVRHRALVGFRADRGRVEAVRLDDASELPCDAALLAVGADPASTLLPGSEHGIDTDECGLTRFRDVYACGDVARPWRPQLGRHVRFEHWTAASEMAEAVAGAVVGRMPRTPCPPYCWSDQFGLRLQFVGQTAGAAQVDLEGSEDAFRARYLDEEGRLVGALLANRPSEVGALRRELAA